MEITIEDEEENPLLNRKEIRFSIVHDGETPSRLAVRDSIAAKIDKASDEVIVHEMNTRFGMNETLGFAKVYEEPEDARAVEQEYMLERNKVATDGEENGDVGAAEGGDDAAEPDEEADGEPEAEDGDAEDEAAGEDDAEADADEAEADDGDEEAEA